MEVYGAKGTEAPMTDFSFYAALQTRDGLGGVRYSVENTRNYDFRTFDCLVYARQCDRRIG